MYTFVTLFFTNFFTSRLFGFFLLLVVMANFQSLYSQELTIGEAPKLETTEITLATQGSLVQLTVMVQWKPHCEGVHREFIRKDFQKGKQKRFIVSLEEINENGSLQTLDAKMIPPGRLKGTASVVLQFLPENQNSTLGLFLCSNSKEKMGCSEASVLDVSTLEKQDKLQKSDETLLNDKVYYFSPLFQRGRKLTVFNNRLKEEDVQAVGDLMESYFGFHFSHEARARDMVKKTKLLNSEPPVPQGALLQIHLANRPRKKCIDS